MKAVCEACGSVHEEVETMRATLVKLQQENGGLRSQLTQMHSSGPLMDDIYEVFDYWCRRLRLRSDTVLGEARKKAVRARLKEGFTVHRLKRAIDGCERDDWAMGRAPKTKGKTFNDLAKHICASDETVERFERLAAGPSQTQGDAARRVLDRLEARDLRVVPSKNGWEAQCPAHDDRVPSMSVACSDDGVLLRCQTGDCTSDDIMAVLGLPTAALFDAWQGDAEPPRPRPVRAKADPAPLPGEVELAEWHRSLMGNVRALEELERRRGWTAQTLQRFGIGAHEGRLVFPVRDAEGQLVTLARYRLNRQADEPKMLGVAGRRRDLFPAPESLIEDDWLWLVEGEPDAVTGHELGLLAVGLPGAGPASQKRLAEWAPRFAGRRVVVCLDCDDEGRACAERVAAALDGVAADVRLVDIDPRCDDGFDLGDWLSVAPRRVVEHSLYDLLAATEQEPPASLLSGLGGLGGV